MLLLLAGQAWAACLATPAEVRAEVGVARAAFTALDREGLVSARDRIEALTACLVEPIDVALAVEVHEVQALTAFVSGDADAAALAFSAARRLDPTFRPDPTLIPRGHPLHGLATRYDPESVTTTRLAPPLDGELLFDGSAGGRPDQVPTVAQWVVDGAVTSSGYLWPDSPMLPYDVARAPAVSLRADRGRSPVVWWALAAGGLAASGVSLALAADARHDWEAATDPDEARALYGRNHLFMGTGAVFGAAGLGLGVGAVVATAF